MNELTIVISGQICRENSANLKAFWEGFINIQRALPKINKLQIVAHSWNPEFDDLVKTVDFIHNRITSNEPVMVHCLAGLGRTGTLLACYLIKYQKMPADEAIQKIREERPGSIQSFPQEEIIFQFAKSVQS